MGPLQPGGSLRHYGVESMRNEGFKRKLSAILSADVVGYSRLMGQDDEATVLTLTRHRELISTIIKQKQGRVVDSPGDNLLAEFESVLHSVECAVEIQRKLADRNAALSKERRMLYRIGVNLGDVIIEGERIYGDGVNITARLEAMAEPGGICISGLVYSQVKNKLKLNFEFLGKRTVKNISEPVPVYRVLWMPKAAGPMEMKKEKVFSPSEKPSIAVLPFLNLSNDPEQEYFSDGITEDLITDLSKISGLFVIARNSVFIYKGKTVRLDEIARELDVRYILEGSVRKAGDRVRITSQLIDAHTGGHLWAERFDRQLTDIFALQDEVTQKIVSSLAVKISQDERKRLVRKGTNNMEAYDYALRGLEYFSKFMKKANAQARRLFEKAIKLDPQYALAYSLAGRTHMMDWSFGWSQDANSIELAFELAQKALRLDDTLNIAFRTAGEVYLWKKQHDKAVSYLRKAIDLSPNDADGYYGLSNVLNWAGQADEAGDLIRTAMRLNPLYPAWYLWPLGHAHFLNREYTEVIDVLTELLRHNPNFLPAHAYLAVTYDELGRNQEAAKHASRFRQETPHTTLDDWKLRLPYKDRAILERFLETLQHIKVSEFVDKGAMGTNGVQL